MTQPLLHGLIANARKSSDKWALYLDIYDHLFAAFRERPISILEIGIQNGGFTEVLAAYFTNAVKIVGCDIDEKCGSLVFSDPRISVVIGDAADAGTASRIKEISDSFDIVIDDGSHRSKDIVAAFCHYFPLLREGGVFIAEDLHCSYWHEYEGGLAHQFSSMSFFKLLGDIVNYEHWGLSYPRMRLLTDMFQHHGYEIGDDALQTVFSVSFYNSMSIVRKKAAPAVLLGERVISGSEFAVADNAAHNHSYSMRNDQQGNPFSDLDLITNKHVFGLFVALLNANSKLSVDHAKLAEQVTDTGARLEEVQKVALQTLSSGIAESRQNQQSKIGELLASLSSSLENAQANQQSKIEELLASLSSSLENAQADQHRETVEKLALLSSDVEAIKKKTTFFDWLRIRLGRGGG
jgi:SAM-dependent methyltransferase